jgi:uncharacterized membrane-anchored protein
MGQGPGTIEKRIAALFAATKERALGVDDIADHAFELSGRPATREQRLSATRAAHRLIRRMKETRSDTQLEGSDSGTEFLPRGRPGQS